MDLSDILYWLSQNMPYDYPVIYGILNWIYLNVFTLFGFAVGAAVVGYLAPAAVLLIAYRVKNGSFNLLEGKSLDFALGWPLAAAKGCYGLILGNKNKALPSGGASGNDK